jgi:plastocyanin
MAAVLIALTGACSSGSFHQTGHVTATGPANAQTATIDTKDNLSFDPNLVDAKVGTLTLTIRNLGQVPHNLVFSLPGLGQTSTVQGRSTATLTVTFTKAGTYAFVCTFHSNMTGKVDVSP